MDENVVGGRFEIDITDLQAGIKEANRLIRLADSEFKAATAGMDRWADSADGLAARQQNLSSVIGVQEEKVRALKSEYERVSREMGENSAEAQGLQIRINNETAALERNRAMLRGVTSALDAMSPEAQAAAEAQERLAREEREAAEAAAEAERKAEEYGQALTNMGDRAKAAVATGLKALAAGVAAVTAAFIGSAESTREYRNEMAKLDTAFTTNGHSSEAAKDTYMELQGVLGDDAQAVEAANHLALLTNNEKDLQKWTNIATGVYATFGASLPIEGLTEAANETAKVGQVTGPLADALNWAGISEDKFNESLAKCTSEQERQTLIADTLNGVYDDAAKKFKETNKEVIEANKANAALSDTMAEVGAIAEPVVTMLKKEAAELLTMLVDRLKNIDIKGTVQGVIDTSKALLNTVIPSMRAFIQFFIDNGSIILATLAGIGTALVALNYANIINALVTAFKSWKVITDLQIISQGLLNAVMNANPFVRIAALVLGLVAAIGTLWVTNEGFRTKVIEIWGAIKEFFSTTITSIAQFFTEKWQGLSTWFSNLLQGISIFFTTIWNAIKFTFTTHVTTMSNAFKTFFSAIRTVAENGMNFIRDKFGFAWSAVETGFNAFKELFSGNFSGFLSGIFEAATVWGEGFYDIGADIIDGIWAGIEAGWDWLVKQVQSLATSLFNAAKKALGINSPSKEFAWLGEMSADGYGVGFEKKIGSVMRDVQSAISPSLNINASSSPAAAQSGGGVVINQYNTSPKALSAYEVYRQTKIATRLVMVGR